MSEATFTFRVIAPAGLYLPGFGSRECGDIFIVSVDQAILLETVDGLERVPDAAPPEIAADQQAEE